MGALFEISPPDPAQSSQRKTIVISPRKLIFKKSRTQVTLPKTSSVTIEKCSTEATLSFRAKSHRFIDQESTNTLDRKIVGSVASNGGSILLKEEERLRLFSFIFQDNFQQFSKTLQG